MNTIRNELKPAIIKTNFDAHGSRILVTGAGGLIGRTLVTKFSTLGAQVIAVDRNTEILESAAQHWPNEVLTLAVDLADAESVVLLKNHPYLTEIDVLVNNAAITQLRSSLLETAPADIDLIQAVNVRAVIMLSQIMVRHWITSARGGCIVHLSSMGASRAHENQGVYDSSKGAIDTLTRVMAVEWGKYGIRINALAPAAVSEVRQPVTDAPLGWASTGLDIANAILWLASDAAMVVTGQIIALDGGLLSRLRTHETE